ncbi:jg23896 [Pararge aegeria aegeria]|uniref:Jg23896 protein n=1 Tax=Pararge aegeria aegeria TaxID=348720 RepID=A0A8S4S2J7_9NEOP|nr:jg23896 [Pararge aegeria aegeria]
MGHYSTFKCFILLAKVINGISLVQANLQRKRLATQELLKEAVSRKVDISLVQEPYVGADGFIKQYNGVRVVQKHQGRCKPVKAAIVIHNDEIVINEDPALTTENIAFAAIKTKNRTLNLISVYFEVDEPLETYLDHVKTIVNKINTRNLILGGDVNAWSTWWGSSKENQRGADLASFLNEMELHILNIGDEPTFETENIARKSGIRLRVDNAHKGVWSPPIRTGPAWNRALTPSHCWRRLVPMMNKISN